MNRLGIILKMETKLSLIISKEKPQRLFALSVPCLMTLFLSLHTIHACFAVSKWLIVTCILYSKGLLLMLITDVLILLEIITVLIILVESMLYI